MPYRIALLSKFPPIEGGIATKTFWLARGLAKRGHEVHVITHGISAGGEYRIQGGENIPQDITNLWVHRPSEEIPWHIPDDKEQSLSLLDLTLNVIRKYDIQILDTGYLIPYGIIGNLAKLTTGVCHIVRHGGSDIEKFLKKGVWDNVLHDAIKQADMVITDNNHESTFKSITQNTIVQTAYIPDEEVFKSLTNRSLQKRVAFIGKINYHWQHKGLDRITEIMNQISGQFECLLIVQGNGMKDFQDNISADVVSKFKWLPFVPPWEMPQILNQVDAIFIFESKLPHPVISNVALEALDSGVGIVTDRVDFIETYRDIIKIDINQIIIISSLESPSSTAVIKQWIKDREYDKNSPRLLVSFQEYLSANEKIYTNILKN